MAFTITLFCVLGELMHDQGNVFPVQVSSTDTGTQLRDKCHKALDGISCHSPAELTLWKLNSPVSFDRMSQNEVKLFDATIISNLATKISSKGIISSYWTEYPAAGHLHIVISISGNKRGRDSYEADEAAAAKLQKLEYDILMTPKRKHLSRESLTAAAEEAETAPSLPGRPAKKDSLPIHVYHPIFADFQANVHKKDMVPTAEEYAATHSLLVVSAEPHITSETLHREALKAPLHAAVPHDFALTATDDGTMLDICSTPSNGTAAMSGLREISNVISDDPITQGSASYRKYWSQKDPGSLRRLCCCPSMILAIAGPWMCVLGAVYTDIVLVQQLTDLLYIGHSLYRDDRIDRIARTLSAFSRALGNLATFYDTLMTSRALSDRIYPHVQCYANMDLKSISFKYLSRLENRHTGETTFLARTELGREVVVKFVQKYNTDAHRLLTFHGYAPELLYSGVDDPHSADCGPLRAIVMEYIPGETALDAFGNTLPAHLHSQVQTALALLHGEGLVFGNLQPHNIIVTADGKAVLVGFDWCGLNGVERYPFTISDDMGTIKWHPDVRRNGVMSKQHDMFLLNAMR